jgi:hypothetical protein
VVGRSQRLDPDAAQAVVNLDREDRVSIDGGEVKSI